jgi:hypothetical protein
MNTILYSSSLKLRHVSVPEKMGSLKIPNPIFRRGHTMTTIEGQLAVLGGAATRPQGDTEVNFSMTSSYQTIDLPLFKMIYMYVRNGSLNNKTDDLQTEGQLTQGDGR